MYLFYFKVLCCLICQRRFNSCAFAAVEKAENACILNLSLLLRAPMIGVKHEHERLKILPE